MINFRKQAGGFIFAPKRGKPPECPDGYTRDSKNPYRFYLTLEPCPDRDEIQQKAKCCGGIITRPVCKKSGQVITREMCKVCQNIKLKSTPKSGL